MYRTIHTSPTTQLTIGCIYDRVDLKCRNIGLNKFYSIHILFLVSIMIVTGPSLQRSTFISAPNSPDCTVLPNACSTSAIKLVYNGTAISGFAAFMYDGRFPFFVLACNVN